MLPSFVIGLREGVAPSLLAQEAGDDADDERGLDALAGADHKTGQQ